MVGGRRTVALVLAVLLLTASLPAAAIGAAQTADPDADNTVTRIELAADGSATWIVRVRTRLETEADVQEFERFQASFEQNKSERLDRFSGRIDGVVRNAVDATGREMTAENFSQSTSIQELPRRWGVVTYRFRWRGFARVDGDRVVAGDVFGSGFYIDESDSLEVVAPPGYALQSVAPDPASRDGRTVTWVGPESFADGRPLVRAAPSATPTSSLETTPADSAGEESRPLDLATAPYLLGTVAVGAVAVLALLFTRRRSGAPHSVADTDRSPSGGGAGPPRIGGGDSDAGPTSADGTALTSATTDARTPSGEDTLLTDEDRVLALLEEHGGRVKQATVGDQLEWSSSKTSRVVGRMADEGTVEKLRIGRENVLQTPASDDETER
ncbi:helix-turn-helix transcriptional regulator [Halobaculum marinum]|uniref:Helix-turn-helix transcriptional regulator n=1 Tax=Halobaculum marinum TaxID=3031996 RepID=A0ABD5X1D0_9EURY|nr:DUF4897 domain-containing protein [Halobaculum sp. DT55]